MSRWVDKVRAIVQAWYPGQEGGRAIADVLLGRVNPSGKLPMTFPKLWEDCPAFGNYPGRKETVNYAEGIFVGYRHFDRKNIEPLFPFGHGLSYTSFSYSNLLVNAKNSSAAAPDIEVSFDIANTGGRAGAEVAQLYVRDEMPKVERPEQELKGFERVELAPGQSRRVTLKLDRTSFAFYDENIHDWSLPPGRFTMRIGASSRDIRLTQAIELK
jgi:beta-glucosidase